MRGQAAEILETALTVASDLRVLATCRWPLGLSDHEMEQEVIPLIEEEARDVFVSHLEYPAHRLEAQETWKQPDSPIRQIVRMSERHPQSLQLDPDSSNGGAGTFEMLRPMLEFARKKYEAANHKEWEKAWIEFWRQRVAAWNEWISGRLPEGVDLPEDQRGAAGARQQRLATALFERTGPNWLAVFEHAAKTNGPLTRWFLLELFSFCQLSGQLILLKTLAQQAVTVLRASGPEEDLAACLGTLGNVQRALGEREEAQKSYQEALKVYFRLFSQWPRAFRQNLLIALRNYTTVTEERDDDPWWQLYKRLQGGGAN